MPRAKGTRVVPLETPWMRAQSLALAQDPYHLELSPWPRGPVGRGSLDEPEPAEETLDDVDTRMQAAEQLAREDTRERTAPRKKKKEPSQKQRDAWARRRKQLEHEAATAKAFEERTDAAIADGWDTAPKALTDKLDNLSW